MKICVIAEGCYPFVPGGVSSWLQEFIDRMPEHEFVVWAVGATEKKRGQFAYKLPPNVTKVYDVYLDTVLNERVAAKPKPYQLNAKQLESVRALLCCESPDWQDIFDIFHSTKRHCVEFLLDRQFLQLLESICSDKYPYIGFSDYFWTVRSMFLPLLYLLRGEAPEADLYHSVSAGYSGVLAALAAQTYKKPYILTEHGIYTREREEEILRSDWVPPHFKDMWIGMFYMFTRCAYDNADQVTSLFHRASLIQQEIGCEAAKCTVVSNGVHIDRFAGVPEKVPDGWVDIGAIVRVVPIKDIKTMLFAFAIVEAEMDNVRLHVMGPQEEDKEYYAECLDLTKNLGLKNVIFTGRVNVVEYLAKVDFTLLTSISEGQPLSVLEGMAAGRPAVTTDVGSCKELIDGVNDPYGPGGLCVPVMHQSALAGAMLQLSRSEKMRKTMGENGRRRVQALYAHTQMMANYRAVYDKAMACAAEKWGDTDGGHRV